MNNVNHTLRLIDAATKTTYSAVSDAQNSRLRGVLECVIQNIVDLSAEER